MTAYNAVRFKVKPGMEKAFEDAHRIHRVVKAAWIVNGQRVQHADVGRGARRW